MRGTFVPFPVTVLVSTLVLFTPGGQVPAGPWWSDDVVHITIFMLLAVTGRMLPVRGPVLTGGLLGYAAFSEVVQAVAPLHRTGSLLDVLADLVGIGLGLGISAVHSVHRRRTRQV
ncbi:MAG: VanZ family protein [Pseudonocardiaceae bacterium]